MSNDVTSKLLNGPKRPARMPAEGNGALLLLVDSSGPYWERSIVDDAIFVALDHFGMPYRICDLAETELTEDLLGNCAAIIIAQNGMGHVLGEKGQHLISNSVASGIGLVNFDYDLRQYIAPMLKILGFDQVDSAPWASDQLRISEEAHYITELQEPGELHEFSRMVTGVKAKTNREDVYVLAQVVLGKEQLVFCRHLVPGNAFEPGMCPVIFAGEWGRGRAVQFTLNMRVWLEGFHGHAKGMDDLMWRSIVWAARKPFAAHIMLPFVCLTFDDCKGRYDFKYLDIASRYGYVPTAALFLDDTPERLYPTIREDQENGNIQYCTHAHDYYRLLTYDFGRGEYSQEQLEKSFQKDDEFWQKVGTKQFEVARMHWGEYGVAALPFLKARGKKFFNPARFTGLQKADQLATRALWPYGAMNSYYGFLPDDHDFFVFSASMGSRHTEDFLTGVTTWAGESLTTDPGKIASIAAQRMAVSFRSGFHCEIITHEQKFDSVSLSEWDNILAGIKSLSASYNPRLVGLDKVAQYIKGKYLTSIKKIIVNGNDIKCELEGESETPLEVSIFRNDGKSICCEYVSTGTFTGVTKI